MDRAPVVFEMVAVAVVQRVVPCRAYGPMEEAAVSCCPGRLPLLCEGQVWSGQGVRQAMPLAMLLRSPERCPTRRTARQ